VVEKSIVKAIKNAESLGGIVSYRELEDYKLKTL